MEKTTNLCVQQSNDYSLFSRIDGNRKPSPAHTRALSVAISANPEVIKYNPILVNEHREIIDGQHRLGAIKSLELPVYYLQVAGLGLKDVQALNSKTRPWSPSDYAKSYDELGNKNYTFYLAVKSKYALNHDVVLRYVALHKPITTTSFKEGKLKVVDEKGTHKACSMLVDLGKFYPDYKFRGFALAVLKIYLDCAETYDHKRMLEKMGKYAHLIEYYSTPEDYIRALEKVYNYKVAITDRVRFI